MGFLFKILICVWSLLFARVNDEAQAFRSQVYSHVTQQAKTLISPNTCYEAGMLDGKLMVNALGAKVSAKIGSGAVRLSKTVLTAEQTAKLEKMKGMVVIKLTNAEVRLWYNQQIKLLNTNVPFTEANAKVLHNQRNALKTQARTMMSDREKALLLEQTDPINSFEYYVEKYTKQGYSGEKLWERIIKGSVTPNPKINSKFNIK